MESESVCKKELSGKVALITGAASNRGVGRAAAVRLARDGADVVVVDLPFDRLHLSEDDRYEGWRGLDSVVEEIQDIGQQALSIDVDIANSRQVDEMVQKAVARFGQIDILVNNAAILGSLGVPIVQLDDDIWNRVLAVNLTGPFLCSRAVARVMIQRNKGGRIINISSFRGKEAGVGLGAYSSSKFGLIGLTQTLALELASHKITVNAICPGHLATDMASGGSRGEARRLGISIEEVTARRYAGLLPNVPLGRIGQPEDIANAVAFLASSQSDYITGQAINVNGGRLIAH
jgi:meso-butanediol dehydrogenase/(S,S)-butanediol dehydrogenase/diacetyl reductase